MMVVLLAALGGAYAGFAAYYLSRREVGLGVFALVGALGLLVYAAVIA